MDRDESRSKKSIKIDLMQTQELILVDENDRAVGIMDKMETHRKGLLHRAFSVFIFNKKGEMLLQQRASGKYHSPGLWTNACCSHPFPGEAVADAASRRLSEELGFTTILHKAFSFIYRSEFDNGLTEYEYDHVFTGEFDGEIRANISEVQDYDHRTMEQIEQQLAETPDLFTPWFRIAFPKIAAVMSEHKMK